MPYTFMGYSLKYNVNLYLYDLLENKLINSGLVCLQPKNKKIVKMLRLCLNIDFELSNRNEIPWTLNDILAMIS